MQRLALLLLASSALALPASGAGGLVVVGVGDGAFDPPPAPGCDHVLASIVAVFAPGDQGSLSFQWSSPGMGDCFLLANGGMAGLGQLDYDLGAVPPASFTFACVGNEAAGLACAQGCLVLGPYPGPGGQAKLTSCGGFAGTFTVV